MFSYGTVIFSKLLRANTTEDVAYDHTTINILVLVWSPKSRMVGPGQYLDGWPPGNTCCCRLAFFLNLIFKSLANYNLLIVLGYFYPLQPKQHTSILSKRMFSYGIVVFSKLLRANTTEDVAYDHNTINILVLVWSPKSRIVGPGQYLDGWPRGNTWCCRLAFF